MTLTQAFALGVLQGGTEFLPVSSSGHLALAQNLMPGLSGSLLLFDVVVHVGTLIAIVVLLRDRVLALIQAALSFLPGGSPAGLEVERRWLGLILAGSVPTAVIGLALRETTEAILEKPAAVGAALLVTGVVLFLSERLGRRDRGAADLTWLDALAIGTAQGLAVIPGISRSGATVAAALARNADGRVAVEFSLLLSMPAIAGAALLVGLEHGSALEAAELAPLGVGFAAALVTGMLALRALQWIVVQRRLLPFAAYCVVLGAGALVLG